MNAPAWTGKTEVVDGWLIEATAQQVIATCQENRDLTCWILGSDLRVQDEKVHYPSDEIYRVPLTVVARLIALEGERLRG
ncbi:MAG TPA: hypothetical protein VHO25_18340 [Polyangiaceae bacterium]|nr:hypothetical protein [Polyangiaceae bacterium]